MKFKEVENDIEFMNEYLDLLDKRDKEAFLTVYINKEVTPVWYLMKVKEEALTMLEDLKRSYYRKHGHYKGITREYDYIIAHVRLDQIKWNIETFGKDGDYTYDPIDFS